jgi:acyl-CoA synthetase (AMP-forming)/AMP-acid ligase II
LTFAQLGQRLDESARAHMAWGIGKGDRFAVWAPNMWEWPIAALGGHRAGGVLVPINTRFKGREAAFVLAKSKARILFTVTDFLDTDYVELLRGTGEDLDLEQIVICVATCRAASRSAVPQRASGVSTRSAWPAQGVTGSLYPSVRRAPPARRRAMLVQRPSAKAYLAWADVVGLTRASLPHRQPILPCVRANSGIILPHEGRVHRAQRCSAAVMTRARNASRCQAARHHQTIPPPPEASTWLRLSVTGAAAVPVEMITKCERLGFETIVTGLASPEPASPRCAADDDPETIAHTSGRAIPDVEVLIVDRQGNEVPRGEPGEIVVRGYNVMKGYLGDPEQTAETIDADGWLHTGDIGTMDERGYIDITDRVDMFIAGRFNAYPPRSKG